MRYAGGLQSSSFSSDVRINVNYEVEMNKKIKIENSSDFALMHEEFIILVWKMYLFFGSVKTSALYKILHHKSYRFVKH
jgi:hypothetical protein